jgi:predicted enzyme related to lactoylglutathione lyase
MIWKSRSARRMAISLLPICCEYADTMLSGAFGYNTDYAASRLDRPKEKIVNFVSIRIITADLARLACFYEQITGISVTMYTEDFGELKTPACTLAIGSTHTLQLFGGDVARPADNHTAIIEFRVGDVDAEYRKLADVIGDSLVQEPTTMGATARSCSAIRTATWSTSSRRSVQRQSRNSTSDRSIRQRAGWL